MVIDSKLKTRNSKLFFAMAFIVTAACVDCKYTSCVPVCPVEAFHEAPDRLYINPDTCIDCNACVSECPVNAIYAEREVPDNLQEWIKLNADEAAKFPLITGTHEPLKGPKCVDPNAG
jgi:ferredoxin